jgi:hypothetical protein
VAADVAQASTGSDRRLLSRSGRPAYRVRTGP